MAEIIIDGKKVFYEVTGKGDPVILIHGWRCTHKTVKIIADYLSENFKVYNIDVIGFGNSEMPDKPMNSDQYGDWLKKLVKALEIKNYMDDNYFYNKIRRETNDKTSSI